MGVPALRQFGGLGCSAVFPLTLGLGTIYRLAAVPPALAAVLALRATALVPRPPSPGPAPAR